jgi:hypothetical protein
VKYIGTLNAIKALRRQLGASRGERIRITGGLPPDALARLAPAKSIPGGVDLKRQHAMFVRPKGALKSEPEAVVPVDKRRKV